MTLRRGFKTEAERLALAIREELGVSRTAPPAHVLCNMTASPHNSTKRNAT